MPSTSFARRLSRVAAVVLLAVSVAACVPLWPDFMGSAATPIATEMATPIPTPSPTPIPTLVPTPFTTLGAFKAAIARSDFQAQGTVSGEVKVNLFLGSTSGPITGTFRVKGSDSDVSIGFKILSTEARYDNIVVGGSSYSRTNGGAWSKGQASGSTLQGFVASALFFTDQGVESKFGKQLHNLKIANVSGLEPSDFGISIGSDAGNLTIGSLSFWAQDDGTPAGLSMSATLDQKILGTTFHETVTLDIAIDSLSGVTITAPVV